jgi:subtilisin family serine protease
VGYAEPDYILRPVATPNDPYFPQEWALLNTSVPGADIGATNAWAITTGSTANVVGVVDSGIDYTHPDLAANVWAAPSGFTVQLASGAVTCPAGSHGYNAITRSCDPRDDNNHGTHVSGTIGAAGNNQAGVTGINWTTRIMGLKFIDSTGSGTTSGAIDAIEFALQAKQVFGGAANVRVLSNSYGGSGNSQSLLAEINTATAADVLFVAAAGNDSNNNDVTPEYPASYTTANVISVAATTSTDALASFSNYGATSVHLGAPGQNIISTVTNASYGYYSGTSMATPHVSGAAMLVLSRCSLNTANLKSTLLANVDVLPSLTGRTSTGGRLNVFKALQSCAGTVVSGNNLAVGKSATQSSTLLGYGSSAAGNAVDGNTNGNFSNGSVTHTNYDANAWWQVDLGSSSSVTSVVISNRTDCCADRLSDYWIFVSDTAFGPADTPATLQGRAGTWSSHQTTIPNPSSTIPVNAQGRYVRVQLGNSNYLSLAEVQVTGTPGNPIPPPSGTNLAAGKAATQSSTLVGYGASGAGNAVDGNTDGNFFNGSVTHTNSEANAWWQVDLGSSASITSVAVWNRTDCCADRLSDYWVFVSDTPYNAGDTPATLQGRAGTWSTHQIGAPSPLSTITLGAQGRYVRVQLGNSNFLSLAEVQVMGTAGTSGGGGNLAVGKASAQSSTLLGYGESGANNANDGNTDGNFFDHSVSHTNYDANAWWQVDLGSSASISSIVIWNRTDCCSDRLSDYWVFVSATPFAATDTPSTLQGRAGTWGSHQVGVASPSASIPVSAQGRYVRVQLSTSNYLNLAEVQVNGQ